MSRCLFCNAGEGFGGHSSTCIYMLYRRPSPYFSITTALGANDSPRTPSLEARVTDDLGALFAANADFFNDATPAPAELPKPDPDYTTYVDAFASAAKNCDHKNAINIRYAREWHCPDCGKYLSRGDLGSSWWMYG